MRSRARPSSSPQTAGIACRGNRAAIGHYEAAEPGPLNPGAVASSPPYPAPPMAAGRLPFPAPAGPRANGGQSPSRQPMRQNEGRVPLAGDRGHILTEVAMPKKLPVQKSLMPDVVPDKTGGNIPQRIAAILDDYADARDDYRLVLFYYWWLFDDLPTIIGLIRAAPTVEDAVAVFRGWLRAATSPKTIQNRAQEIQHDVGSLDASPDVRQERDRQARAGRIVQPRR